MSYNIGDEVIINIPESYDEYKESVRKTYGSGARRVGIAPDMRNYNGSSAYIIEKHDRGGEYYVYRINLDHREWLWDEVMLHKYTDVSDIEEVSL